MTRFCEGTIWNKYFYAENNRKRRDFFNAYGAVISKTLKENEEIIVNNYQLVAFSSSTTYEIIRHGNWKTTLYGGEGLLIRVIGPGIVYMQSKNIIDFVNVLAPFLPWCQGHKKLLNSKFN